MAVAPEVNGTPKAERPRQQNANLPMFFALCVLIIFAAAVLGLATRVFVLVAGVA